MSFISHKFNISTVEALFIKSLLYNTYLPTYETVKVGDFIIDGFYYVYGSSVIKCVSTGYIGGKISPKETYDDNEDTNSASYYEVCQYEFGKEYRKFTDRFISKFSYYDRETHNRLAKYIRCYRDIYGVDMMPYINLSCNEVISDMRLTYTNSSEKSVTLDDDYNGGFSLIAIPIRFNQEYTIALECNSNVIIAPAFFSHDMRLVINDVDLTNLINSTVVNNDIVGKRFMSTRFRNPIVYSVDITKMSDDDRKKFYSYRNNLYMLIQIPKKLQTSAVVLEGNYSKSRIFFKKGDTVRVIEDGGTLKQIDVNGRMCTTQHIINSGVPLSTLKDVQMNESCLSDLSLLQVGTPEYFAFSNRLIEYLSGTIIDRNCNLDENVEKYQKLIPNLSDNDYIDGVWNNHTRKALYDFVTDNKKSSLLDINGFLDKDSEKLLLTR